MKRLLVILAMLVMLSCAFTTACAADGYVGSPESGNTDVEKTPTSPQTGYEVGIGGVVLTAAVCGAGAVVAARKSRSNA